MSKQAVQIADSISRRDELAATRINLAEKIRNITDGYLMSEQMPEGKKMPTGTWDQYQTYAQQMKVAQDEELRLNADIQALQAEADRQAATGPGRLSAREAFVAYAFEGTDQEHRRMTDDERERFITSAPEGTRYAGQKCFRINAAMTRTGAGADTSAAAAIPVDYPENALTENMKAYGGASNLVSIYPTATGVNVPIPNVDATSQEGVILGEGVDASDLDLPDLGSTTLGDHIYTSRVATVTWQTLRDATFNVESWMRMALLTRISRILSKHIVNGDNVSKPQGFLTATGSGKVTASTDEFTWTELLDLYESVDDGYLMGEPGHGLGMGGMIAYAMNKQLCVRLMQLADSENRPLYLPNIHNMGGMMLFGYPVQKVYEMPDWAANAKVVAFGNFGYYILRIVEESMVLVFNDSNYAKGGKTGFLAFAEADGRWVQRLNGSNVDCVKALTVKAS